MMKRLILTMAASLAAVLPAGIASGAAAQGAAPAFRPGAYQTEDGALRLHRDKDIVDPYFAAKALLAARDAGLSIQEPARRWIEWAQARQLPDGRLCRFDTDGGRWIARQDADADDSMLALWIHLVSVVSPEKGTPPAWKTSVLSARRTLETLREKRGTYRISTMNPVGLMMDNVEVYAALLALADAQARWGDVADAAKTRGDAGRLAEAIRRVFWDTKHNRFHVSTQTTPEGGFYPGALAQVYPWLAGMPTPDGDARAAFRHWLGAHEAEWLSMRHDAYPWGLVAVAARQLGNEAAAQAWRRAAAPLRNTGRWNVLEEAAYQGLLPRPPAQGRAQ